VMRATPTAIWIAHDRDCTLMTGNPASYDLVRRREGSNVSATGPVAAERGFVEYRNGAPVAPDQLPLQRAAARGVELVGEEFSFRFDDGSERHVYGNAVPLWDGDGTVRGAVGAFVDITSLKQSQAMLQRRTAGLRLLADAAALVLAENDPDATVKSLFDRIAAHAGIDLYASFSANPAARTLRLAASRGLSPAEQDELATVAYGEAVCGAVAERGTPVVVSDVQRSVDPMVDWLRRAGVAAYVSYPLTAGGRLLGTLAFGSRTRTRLADDELEFLGTLAHYVTLAHEHARLVGELRESDRRKDEFLATLAHELRNPLAPIRNGLSIMKRAGTAPPAAEYARTVLERQLMQMVRIVDDLLDVSRVTAGKLHLHRETVTIGSVIAAAVDTARPAIEAGRHALAVDVPAQPLLVHADPLRLAQVFTNLHNNAAKYTDGAGRITVRARAVGGDVEVSVADQGLGIAPEALARIFEPFAQVDHSLERTRGGLGIGLTLAKRVVELHGGRIEARSDGPGRGSEFIVCMALASADPSAPGPPDETHAGAGRALRILVADDNRDAAQTLGMVLRMSGHDVCVVHDGAEAVRAAVESRPQVAILDIGMPEINGYEAARRIRAAEASPRTVLAALTGWGQYADLQRARDAGFDHHFTKPVDFAALEKMLASVPAEAATFAPPAREVPVSVPED